eukprot:6001606-Prymnesium_polylepis.1
MVTAALGIATRPTAIACAGTRGTRKAAPSAASAARTPSTAPAAVGKAHLQASTASRPIPASPHRETPGCRQLPCVAAIVADCDDPDSRLMPPATAYYAEEDRWDTLASELGQLVLSVAPRWLVVVEGVGHCMDPSEAGGQCTAASSMGQNMKLSTWWGENLQAASQYPIDLGVPQKLVYSPHVYGPSVAQQPYFNDGAFPRNMPTIWRTQWSQLPKLAREPVPVLIGEWGG